MSTNKKAVTGEGNAPRVIGTSSDWIAWMDLLSPAREDKIAEQTGFCINGKFDMSKESDFDKACNQARIEILAETQRAKAERDKAIEINLLSERRYQRDLDKAKAMNAELLAACGRVLRAWPLSQRKNIASAIAFMRDKVAKAEKGAK